MGQPLGKLYAELRLDTSKMHSDVEMSNRELAKLEADIDKTTDEINAKLAKIGGALSLGVTAPLTMMGTAALNTFTNFEQAMQNTYSVMGAGQSEMDALRKKAEEMGASTRFSASQAADALYSLGSAGQNASQAMNSLDGVLRLAGATGSDLAFTSDTIASTLSQFNLTADKSAHIADVFSQAISKSQANMTKLSYSMKYVGPVASGLNISLETATAALMNLYNTGFGGEQAGTILRAGLQKLASGTDQLKNKLHEYGLSYDEINPKVNNLADIMDRLKEANIGVTEANELFGEASSAGMAKLIEQGGDAIRTMDGLLVSSDGAAAKMQEIQNASFANTKAELQSAFEAVQITIMSNVMPAIDTLAKGATSVLNFINELPVGVQTAGTALATLAAAAGPLLLVALGVRKIKVEMAQLNMVMTANPIFAIGTAVAAVGVIALGVIAQVKKSWDEAEKAAGKYYERAASLAEEAKSARSKNNSISELLETYETLHNKTVKTTEEQARYNETLNKLKELVPDIVTGQEAIGDAYLQNVEKAKAAQRELLELEKQKKEQALAVAQASRVEAQKTVDKYNPDWNKAKEQLDKANAEMVISEKQRDQIRRLVDVYKTADKKRRAEIGKELEQLSAAIGEYAFRADDEYAISVGNSLDTLVNFAEEKLNKTLKKAEKASGKFEKLNAKIEDAQNIIANIETLEREIAAIENMQTANDTADTKKTRQQYADEAIKAYREKAKQIDDEAKKAVEAGNKAYDAIDEKIKEIQSKIDQLIKMSGDAIIDGAFTQNSIELKTLYAELNRLQALKEKGKSSGGKKSAEVIDNSYQAQIKKLDESYQTQLQQAKDFGKDMNAIEQAWRDERAKLIDGFIDAEIAKEQKKNKALSDADARQKAEAITTNKDTTVTLGDEKYKTQFMGPGLSAAIARTKAEREQLKKDLAYIYEQIGAINAMGLDLAVDSAEKQATLAYLAELKSKAEEIELHLNPDYKSNADIEKNLQAIHRANTSEIKKQWDEIEAKRKEQLADIKSAKERGVGDFKGIDQSTEAGKKQAEAVEKNLTKSTNKIAGAAKASIALGLVEGALSVANTLTDIIMDAVENGFDGAAFTTTMGGLISQIGGMIPGIAGLSIGVIGQVTGFIGGIIQRVQQMHARQAKKEIEDVLKSAEPTASETAQKFVDNLQKELSDKAYAPMKDAGKSLFDAITGGFQSGDFSNFSKALDDIIRKMVVEKMIFASGLSGAVQKLVDNMFGGFTGSGEQRLGALNEQKKVFEAERAQLENESIAYDELVKKKNYLKDQQSKWWGWLTGGKHQRDKGYIYWSGKDFANAQDQIDMELAKLEGSKEKYRKLTKELERINEESKKINPNEKADLTQIKKMDKSELERLIKEYGEPIKEVFKMLGIEVGSDFQATLNKMITEMASSLTQALGDAAYNADWDSFKKAFAAEMKKAIIESALQSAGIKQKVDAIIKGIMEDGTITGDEINATIEKLKPIYDTIENNMAEVAKITKALSGDKAIEMKAKGEIIQQLSGADRDWFTEVFQEGFSKMSIAVQETNIQYLAASQLIINTVHFTSNYGSVYITANENTDLKGLITEIVREVVA